jgi:hypothetical protein
MPESGRRFAAMLPGESYVRPASAARVGCMIAHIELPEAVRCFLCG